MRLQVLGLAFQYGNTPVLSGVDLAVGAGEVLSLIGPNGAGKSTLLKCVQRLLIPMKGTVLIDGNDLMSLSIGRLPNYLGYVPQSTHTSFPMTVFDNILLGRTPHLNFRVGARDKEVVYEVMDRMGLERFALRDMNELSGGERQRVCIARALAQEPQVLLLDEPTSNLDLRYQLEILTLIRRIAREKQLSAIMAIHDLNLALRFSDKLALLSSGRILVAGPPGVLTEANIREAYGVEVRLVADGDRPYVVPLEPVNERPRMQARRER